VYGAGATRSTGDGEVIRLRRWLRRSSVGAIVVLLGFTVPWSFTRGNRIIGGNVTLVALWVAIALFLVVLILSSDFVARRFSVQAVGGIDTTFEYARHFLLVEIRNDGPTMRDAGANIFVPKRCGIIVRMNNDGSFSRGRENEDGPSLTDDGEPSLHWHEKGLHLLGGGNRTTLAFRVNGRPGEHPVRLTLFDDADFPRSVNVRGTFTIPPRDVDWSARSRMLESLKAELDWNSRQLRHALASGSYSLDEGRLGVGARYKGARVALDYDGVDQVLIPKLKAAYDECERLSEVVEGRARLHLGGEAPPDTVTAIEDDRCEQALVVILDALVGIGAARRADAGPNSN
jgi:hypothetical protein